MKPPGIAMTDPEIYDSVVDIFWFWLWLSALSHIQYV